MVRRLQRRGFRNDDESFRNDNEFMRENRSYNNLEQMSKEMKPSSQQYDNNLVAELAQGFMQAQANISDSFSNVNNQEIVLLLQKINKQLETIQQSTTNNQSAVNNQQAASPVQTQSAQQTQGTQNQNSKQGTSNNSSNSNGVSKELQTLFSQLLQGDSDNSTNTTSQQNNKNVCSSSDKKQKNNSGNSLVAQTAAQVLAQAQYELSNELEASLNKLKQVITESEKIANKISNLLGEENSTNKS